MPADLSTLSDAQLRAEERKHLPLSQWSDDELALHAHAAATDAAAKASSPDLTTGEALAAAGEGARQPAGEIVRYGLPLAAAGAAIATGAGAPLSAGAAGVVAPFANRAVDLIQGKPTSFQRDAAAGIITAAGGLMPTRFVPVTMAARAPVAAGAVELGAHMATAGAAGTALTAAYQSASGEGVDWHEALKMGGLTAVLGGIGGALRAAEVTRMGQTDRDGLMAAARNLGFEGKSWNDLKAWHAEHEQVAREMGAKPVEPTTPPATSEAMPLSSAPTEPPPAQAAAAEPIGAGLERAPDGTVRPIGSAPTVSPAAAISTAPAATPAEAPPPGSPSNQGTPVAVPAQPAPAIETPTTTHLEPAAHPVQEFPVAKVAVNKDIQQFKGDANAQGVVEPLAGKFERLGTAPVVLWQKQNGETEVITGRHRLDLARRSGEQTIPAQVVKESDGFTKQMALTFDAESNIRDGQGTIKDYAHYFRNSPGLDPATADARGLRARAKGAAGWALGKDASDDLYTLYANGELAENKAVAIARGAPGRPEAQASAMRAAKGMGAPELEFYARNLARLTTPAAGAGGAEQMGFGGIATDFAAYEEQAKKVAAVQAERMKANNDLIQAAQGAAKKPEAARKMGLPVEDPAALQARIDELRAHNAKLANPDSETWRELAQAAGVEVAPAEPAAPAPPEPSPTENAPLADPGTMDMFGDMAPSLPPTALDQHNGGALPPGEIKLELPAALGAKDIPAGVRNQVFQALETLADIKRIIAEQKGGAGGYHAELATKEHAARKADADAIIAEFRKMAPQNGIDADSVLKELATWKRQGGDFAPPAPPREQHSMASGGGGSRGPKSPAPAAAGAPLTPSPNPNALAKDLQRIQANVAPQTAGSAARFAANLLRELNAKMANELARADEALRPFRNSFDATPVPKDWKFDAKAPLPLNLAFIDAYEGGNMAQLPANERAVAAEFARQNGALIARVHAADPKALKTFYANYFPHLWTDPVKAQSVMGALLNKSPLEGSRSFLKQRTHKLFVDGLAAGLVPVHDNPVDLWLLKQREVERFILGRTFVNEMRNAELLKFVHAFQKAPDGWATVNDRAFTVYGPPTVTVKEAFDAGMRAATLDALAKLGVPHERLVNIGGKRWGYEENVKGVPGTESITSKFGGPDFVIWHELGHALDSRYPEMRSRMFGGTPSEVNSARAARNFKRKLTPNQERIMNLDDELRALADARGGEGKPLEESFGKYVRQTPEKMAVVLQAYLHAPELMRRLAPGVMDNFAQFLRSHPELSIIDDIRPTLELGVGEAKQDVGGQVKLGNWYLPDAAARVVNNFLSPGLNPHLWYRSLREASNIVNGAQLSLSAFHLGFTSLDAAVSRMALAIEDAARGNLGQAAATAASVPASPITNIINGARLRNAVLHGAPTPELAALVRSLEAAGGRIGQDAFWQTQFTRRMVRGFAQARAQIRAGQWLAGTGEGFKAGVQAPLALLEQSLRPILDYVVPRQKLGVFADMASRELTRLGPNATPDQVREAMRKAWDSVDNRMGQVVYDNLFMNRAVKDVALLAFRAYGWQLGKYREGIGAITDTAEAARAKAAGKPAEFTHRMAYLPALLMVVGAIGGVMHYLMTGKRPDGRDYFQPKTGETDKNGNPIRLNLPSYLKDGIAYSRAPVESFTHSLNPLGASTLDLLANKDFYDVQIRNPDDPLWQQGSDVAKWAAGELVPFSVSGAAQLHAMKTPAWKQVAPFFGVTPVPARQTMSPAQALAAESMAASMPSTPMTRHQFEAGKLLKDIVQQMKTGDRSGGMTALAGGIDRGTLNANSASLLVDRMHYSPLQFQVHHLNADTAMRVWRVANEEERHDLRGIVSVKILNSETLSPTAKQNYLHEVQGAAK